MKKFKYLSYLFLIVVIAGLSIIIYSTTVKGNSEKQQKEKALSEVEFLDAKIGTILNQLNNIETRNYNVSVSEISNQEEEQKNKSKASEGKEESGSSSDSGSSTGEEGSNSGSESTSKGQENQSKQQEESGQKYEMLQMGILQNNSQVDWSKIKSEVEILYSIIPTITLDLYQLNLSQEDILAFNKQFDKVTAATKDEDKEAILNELATLYEFIPKFMKETSNEEILKEIAEVKTHLYRAYSKVDSKDWEEIKNQTTQAISKYGNLLSKTDTNQTTQYNISKGYIMLNELQSATDLEDEKIFLIKYKNILEEINNF